MSFLLLLIKTCIVVLLFRYAATRQELVFNPVGKTIAYITNPVFNRFDRAGTNNKKLCVMLIAIGVILSLMITLIFIRGNFTAVLLNYTIMDFSQFFMLFFIISVFLGSLIDKSMTGAYVTFFFRLGSPWVKATRLIFPINSSRIVYPTIFMIFAFFLALQFLSGLLLNVISSAPAINYLNMFLYVLKATLMAFVDLFYYATLVIVIRALLSWVSPDVRNPIVQLIYSITEPLIAPFRRIIPNIGVFDFSALAAVLVIWFLGKLLSLTISVLF